MADCKSDSIQELADSTASKMIESAGLSEESESHKINRDDEMQRFLSQEKAINGLMRIKKIYPQPGQEFCVVAYFLTKETSDDGSRGMWFFIGTFPRADMAKERAISLIEETGIRTVYAMKTCKWQNIDDSVIPNRIQMVPVGLDMKLREQHKIEYQDQVDRYEKDKEIAEEIETEQELEASTDSIEYYTRQWYLVIKSRAEAESLKHQLAQVEQSINQRSTNIRRAKGLNPTHEDEWLSILEKKLPKRGEDKLLELLKQGHAEMVNDIFKEIII